nr:hypothetical protein [uncultured Helicobacter sp.]
MQNLATKNANFLITFMNNTKSQRDTKLFTFGGSPKHIGIHFGVAIPLHKTTQNLGQL